MSSFVKAFSCQGGTFIGGSPFPPGELLSGAQEIKRNAKLVPNAVSDFITSDTVVIQSGREEMGFQHAGLQTLTHLQNT